MKTFLYDFPPNLIFLGLKLLIFHQKETCTKFDINSLQFVPTCDLYTNMMLIILKITLKLIILIIWLLIVVQL